MKNKQQFQELYDTHTLKELSKMFNVSVATVWQRAKAAGLKMKGKGNTRAIGRPRKSVLGF